jgi:predicted transposase YdaD
LHRKVYGEYNEFEEDRMEFPNLRVIEKLHAEIDEIKRSREEAASKVAELEQAREEAVSLAGQRLRDTARNILRLGLSVEQVTQATGLPSETVRTLAAQL